MTIAYLKRMAEKFVKEKADGRIEELVNGVLDYFIKYLEESAHDKRNS